MVLIQVNIPKALDKKIAIENINLNLKDKRKTIIKIIEKYFEIMRKCRK